MADKNEIEPVKKMTLEEYQNKYSNHTSAKRAKNFLILIVAAIGVGIAALLALVVMRVFEMNEYAGYAAIGVAVLIFIFAFIVPVVKITKTKAFLVDIEPGKGKQAQLYNRKLRHEIADKMIELHSKTDVTDWYTDDSIGKLAIARQTNNEASLKQTLTAMYSGEIRKRGNSIIRRMAAQIGLLTAVSQSDKIDTLVVAIFELNLIKKLVYLYGYRPSDARLLKIYRQVLVNSLIAYGASSLTSNLAIGVVNSIGGAMKDIPVLGQVVSTAIGSTSQGIINASMTVVIGFQTIRYLQKEYHLQDILDGIEIHEEDEAEIMEEARKDVLKAAKDAKVKKKATLPEVA